jgi:predicted  nucleic acid-binding Zn-ribbon protein|tara:strand:- start:163 stop:351 length:189 start_codon:yes stop_codon:yes gene_type:complete
MEGYCVKCKKKQEMKSAKCITIKKNGRSAMKGVCPKCGCKMMRFVSSKDCKNKSKRKTPKKK